MQRRDFIKSMAVATTAAAAASCRNAAGLGNGNADAGNVAETPEKMELRLNQNSGDMVSLLGYGCMRWQMTQDENGNNVVDQQSVNELVDYALEHGVNYFDSSPVYLEGQSEIATGIALSRHPRDSYFIATKASNFSDASLENSILMYRKSLEYFKTDYLDYYLLHSVKDGATLRKRFIDNGLIDFLLKERQAGRIRNLGLSFHGSKEGFDELMSYHDKYHWDFIQIQMNYLDWDMAGGRNTNASYLYEELDKREIPIVIMEPLRGGGLSNIPAKVAEEFKTREPDRSIASWAFRFVGSYPRVLTVLSGMTYMEHLQDNIDTYAHFQQLTPEELDWLTGPIAETISNYPLVRCTSCQYCMPCPYGIDIPGIFSFYNKAVNEGTYVTGPDQEGYARARRRYLTAYNKSIPTVRQADHCINCGQCVKACPQRIRIPNELRRIDSYIERLKREDFQAD